MRISDYIPYDAPLIGSKKDEIKINCPMCPTRGKGEDVKRKMYVNLSKGVYNCFRCGARGPIDGDKFKQSLEEMKYIQTVETIKDKINGAFTKCTDIDFDLDIMSWPVDSSITPIALNYLLDRGFSVDEIKKYNIRVGKSFSDDGKLVRKWAGRILFPYISNGKTKYIVGRTYNNSNPKYYNTSSGKSYVLYGLERAKNECIVCEGLISAIATERMTEIPSVPLLGKTISEFQAQRIADKCRKVYLCLDGDVTKKEITKVAMRLWEKSVEVRVVSLPNGQDPDDMGYEFVRYFKAHKHMSCLL